MKIIEMYECYQGEGIRIGERSLLVRTFGCNLLCDWCDTKYSINPKLHARYSGPPVVEYSPIDLAMEVNRRRLPLILSGGEPTLQSDVFDFLASVTEYVTVETNGTIFEASVALYGRDILWSISPKLKSAKTKDADRQSIQNYIDFYMNVQLKFVVTDADDFDGMIDLLESLSFHNSKTNIVAQPNGTVFGIDRYRSYFDAMKELEDRVRISKWPIRVLPQLHTLIHGREMRLK